MDIQIITKESVAASLTMKRTIELMRDAYLSLSSGTVVSPLRTVVENDKGTVLYKPAYSDDAGIFCVKVVSVFPENIQRGLEVTPGIIVVNSAKTGMPIAMVEAGFLTSMRTGAATGIATDTFAKSDAKTAALFGTGGQSRHQLEALLCVREFETIYVFSRNPDNAARFCEENADLSSTCKLHPNPDRKVLKSCDVIATATTSPTAVFADDEISDNVFISAIGSLGPNHSEVPEETLLRSEIIVDNRDACLTEAGEITLLLQSGVLPSNFSPIEIGEILNSSKVMPLLGDPGPVVFKSVGNAAQDLVCVAELLKSKQATANSSSVAL
ncbi:ornithine cyclodeaminase family protein [Coraliomargarita sp. W4R72]